MKKEPNICTELGNDPLEWDKYAPITPKLWFESQLDLFHDAIDFFIKGNINSCKNCLDKIRSSELSRWYFDQAQKSGRKRTLLLGYSESKKIDKSKRDKKRWEPYEKELFKRDGYRCRYCNRRIVSKQLFKKFKEKLKSNGIMLEANKERNNNGSCFILVPCLDHVIPRSIGGTTDINNLVTSCAPCNYGKLDFTIEQMGIEDPRNREPIIDEWDGLESYLKLL